MAPADASRGRLIRATALAAALSVLGFVLPLMLVSHIQPLGMMQGGWEIFLSFGTSWLLHLPVALASALLAALLALLLGRSRAGRALPAIIIASGFIFAGWMGARPWLEQVTNGNPPNAWGMAALCVVAGVLAGWLWPATYASARPPALLLAGAGGVAGLVALAAGLMQPAALPPRPPAPAARPDILLITIDTLSNGHFGSMGYPRPTTPGLDQLGREGAQFTHLVAGSNFTTPTINTLMTGQLPWRHGAFHLKSRPNPASIATALPARLYAAGYNLRAVSTNPYGGIRKNGYARWFDAIETDQIPMLNACSDTLIRWLPQTCTATDIGVIDPVVVRINQSLSILRAWEPGRHSDARMGLAAADRLFRRPADGRPLFLWVHLIPPHDPYAGPAPFIGRFNASPRKRSFRDSAPPYQFAWRDVPDDHALYMARYDEFIASVDADVSAEVRRLERQARLRNSIVIISADHGESFTPDYGGHNGPMLHDALIRIPLIIYGPGIAPGTRISQPVSQADLAPTILALAGGQPAAGSMEGRSLLPLLSGGQLPEQPVWSMGFELSPRTGPITTGSIAMIDGAYKYVRYWGQPDKPGFRDLRDALYNLAADPGETRDLSATEPARSARMRAEIDRQRAAHLRPDPRR